MRSFKQKSDPCIHFEKFTLAGCGKSRGTDFGRKKAVNNSLSKSDDESLTYGDSNGAKCTNLKNKICGIKSIAPGGLDNGR